jgi:hypothetical protein
MKRRQSQDVPTAVVGNGQPLATKRAKSDENSVKVLPSKYEFCPVEDLVVVISLMISELIETNDQLPLRNGVLTRFHSRCVVVFDLEEHHKYLYLAGLRLEYLFLTISTDLPNMQL